MTHSEMLLIALLTGASLFAMTFVVTEFFVDFSRWPPVHYVVRTLQWTGGGLLVLAMIYSIVFVFITAAAG